MKLEDCVKVGVSCCLETVEECIENVHLHSSSLFKYDEMETEFKELYDEYELYKSGGIVIDIDRIRKEYDEELDEYFRNNPPCDESDLEYPEGFI